MTKDEKDETLKKSLKEYAQDLIRFVALMTDAKTDMNPDVLEMALSFNDNMHYRRDLMDTQTLRKFLPEWFQKEWGDRISDEECQYWLVDGFCDELEEEVNIFNLSDSKAS